MGKELLVGGFFFGILHIFALSQILGTGENPSYFSEGSFNQQRGWFNHQPGIAVRDWFYQVSKSHATLTHPETHSHYAQDRTKGSYMFFFFVCVCLRVRLNIWDLFICSLKTSCFFFCWGSVQLWWWAVRRCGWHADAVLPFLADAVLRCSCHQLVAIFPAMRNGW